MAKILRGRISGLYGMESHNAEELHGWADRFERHANYSDPCDDPGWLRRWAKRLRGLAGQKQKAREHKAAQQRRLSGSSGLRRS
jgi:cyclopropane fatty-acyl-phospholipid synthase-like methyltransferase